MRRLQVVSEPLEHLACLLDGRSGWSDRPPVSALIYRHEVIHHVEPAASNQAPGGQRRGPQGRSIQQDGGVERLGRAPSVQVGDLERDQTRESASPCRFLRRSEKRLAQVNPDNAATQLRRQFQRHRAFSAAKVRYERFWSQARFPHEPDHQPRPSSERRNPSKEFRKHIPKGERRADGVCDTTPCCK
jgi:hypothetical protein